MTQSPSLLSVVCPCYNEAEVIADFHAALAETLDALPEAPAEILYVDDGSDDGTLDRLNAIAAEDGRVRVYSFSRNFGHQVAISAGVDHARGDAVVMMDSDLQHPPELIARMVELWRGGAQVVSAVRNDSAGAGLLKRITSRGFYWLINRMTETHVVPGAADFCLLDRRAADAIRSMPERHRFLRGMVSWIGFRREFIPYDAAERPAGHSKYTLRRMLGLAGDAIFSFSTVPIRVATRIGLLLIALGAAYLGYAVIRYAILRDLQPGWPSLLCVMLILGGANLAFLGILGEYVARVFEQLKGRPLYLFKQSPEDDSGIERKN